jgi:O-glycosyl hydrolase
LGGFFWRILTFCLCLHATGVFAQAAVDSSGRLERLPLAGGWLNLHTNVLIPTPNWKKTLSLDDSVKTGNSSHGETKECHAEVVDEAGELDYEILQTVRETKEKTVLSIKATSRNSGECEGVIFFVDLPANRFAGGSWQMAAQKGELPPKLPKAYRLGEALAYEIVIGDGVRQAGLKISLDREARIIVQDSRQWQDCFSILIFISGKGLPKGGSASLEVSMQAKGLVEDAAAHLTVSPGNKLYSIQGLGGNYCFNLDSPTTAYTLEHLKSAFARTEMPLDLWHPPATPGGRALADQPDSQVRKGLELMLELSRRKIPFITTVWRLPGWMYEQAPASPQGTANRIAEDAWPVLLDYIGSYLVYAKEKYKSEPEFFSFNEPDLGIHVKMDEEEYAKALKLVGARLHELGLNTKMLLGDTANPRGSEAYLQAAIKDREALAYAGAVSFHSWGGAGTEEYAAWAKTAEILKLPLIVAEAGVDPAAWKNAGYADPSYAEKEMAHYQELFLYAHPQVVLYWEYTGDYDLLRQPKGKEGGLNERFCLQKHWTEFVPPGSMALQTSSDKADILFTAFRRAAKDRYDEEPRTHYTFHLVNTAWQRQAVLSGLPAAMKELNVVRTAPNELFNKLEPVRILKGQVTLDLPPHSLTTLTTMEVPELEEH